MPQVAEGYAQMMNWATNTLSEREQDAYNAAVNSERHGIRYACRYKVLMLVSVVNMAITRPSYKVRPLMSRRVLFSRLQKLLRRCQTQGRKTPLTVALLKPSFSGLQ